MRYAVVIEKGPKGFGAYVPDLPGCEDGEPVPKPSSSVEFVEVAA
jgi:hypothetical protein